MTALRLAEVTSDNVGAAGDLSVAPHQERYVAPVARSLAEAYTQPSVAWPRLVYAGDDLVGFVMAAFDPGCPIDYFRCGIWRLNIAAEHQKKGYGKFAVEAVLAEAAAAAKSPRRCFGCPESTVRSRSICGWDSSPPARFTTARSSPACGSEPRRRALPYFA
ncbi:GNAT family N-acetyltransferase [Amycolatopsis dendrobii]|uniref:GNAT family N-acetyltransferase n=1 Tax=Amycolatopsis dendrobii TaxID=2760662 RepID=UPI0028AD67CC|nr:GNAT family N-acetyltransferase [Amycolatopsis dendrobii]